jgi:bifunctional non-homologous end joining protein LigD
VRFVSPATAVIRTFSPTGEDWLHEVRFDGWRVQIHRNANGVKIYSRRGIDMADRSPGLRDACLYLPTVAIDAELVACDTDGRPDFKTLRRAQENLCVWCIDLLEFRGQDIRLRPLCERKELLRDLLIETDDDRIRFSEAFPDPVKLLAVADSMGLRGVLSRRGAAAYTSGTDSGWIEVQSNSWRGARELENERRKIMTANCG